MTRDTAPPLSAVDVRDLAVAALVYAYQESHSEGIGCGHDLSPGCRHDGQTWVVAEEGYEYAGSPVRDLMLALDQERADPSVRCGDCGADLSSWPTSAAGHVCAVPRAATPSLDYEQMRVDRGWPTPISMRRAADGLDIFTPARYGDVLRWFADLCDNSLPALRESRPVAEETK